jgi:hypothetical protein
MHINFLKFLVDPISGEKLFYYMTSFIFDMQKTIKTSVEYFKKYNFIFRLRLIT